LYSPYAPPGFLPGSHLRRKTSCEKIKEYGNPLALGLRESSTVQKVTEGERGLVKMALFSHLQKNAIVKTKRKEIAP